MRCVCSHSSERTIPYAQEGRTPDEQDACATARWMTDMDARGELAGYFAPLLTDLERTTAEREGWILGVM